MSEIARAMAAALVAGLAFAIAPSARADIGDYEFRLAAGEIKQGDAVVAVQLIDRRSGEAVADAVIFATRLDMAPDGMAAMKASLEALPSTEPGTYRFRTNLTMAGGWRLLLAAKVQGETGTVENQLVLRVVP